MLDAGIVTFCELHNEAEAGAMPKEVLAPVISQWFEERYIGYGRQYAAKGANEQVDMQIRVWHEGVRPEIRMYALVSDDQYRVIHVTPTLDDENLRVYDVSLMRMERFYDVSREVKENP